MAMSLNDILSTHLSNVVYDEIGDLMLSLNPSEYPHIVSEIFQPSHHITPTLMSLHWLPVCQRITYKLCTIMHPSRYLSVSSAWWDCK